MDFKKNKGASTIDIVVALGIFTIFMSLLAVILTDINSTNLEIQRQSDAITYAISEIEKVKTNGIEKYIGESNSDLDNLVTYEEGYIGDTSYYKKLYIIDYSDISGDDSVQSDIVKKAILEVSYKEGTDTKTITLMTILK